MSREHVAIFIRLPVLCLALGTAPGGLAADVHGPTFSPDGVVAGATMREPECVPDTNSVWVVVGGHGECIRYFHAGLAPSNDFVHVWLHGDRLRCRWASGRVGVGTPRCETISYDRHRPDELQRFADRAYERHGLAYIRLSRPGVYGSSGDHNDRRRPRESLIVNAALDALKVRYAIGAYHLSGQSGGAHVVAALLPRRRDIRCAVLTSGPLWVQRRNALRRWRSDVTGHRDFYDPYQHIGEIPRDDDRHVIVIGDRDDASVPFEAQSSYLEALAAAGHHAWLFQAEGRGKLHHALAHVGFRVVSWCARGEDYAARARAFDDMRLLAPPATGAR